MSELRTVPKQQAKDMINDFLRTWARNVKYTAINATNDALSLVTRKMAVLEGNDLKEFYYWKAVKAELELFKGEPEANS